MESFLRRHIEEIVKITDDKFEPIESYFVFRKFRKRQFLIQEGQPVHEMYLVKSGLVKSSVLDSSDKEHILQFGTDNWWVSDFTAFFKQQSSTLAVEAIEASEVYAISFDRLNRLCEEMPEMEHFFRVKSNHGYVALQQRILSMMSKPAKLRYEEFTIQYPDFVSRIPKQYIASYLGVSRETLSRLYTP